MPRQGEDVFYYDLLTLRIHPSDQKPMHAVRDTSSRDGRSVGRRCCGHIVDHSIVEMTPNEVLQRFIVAHTTGMMASLRSLLELADRQTGLRVYNELRRFTVHLEQKHQFKKKGDQ